VAANDLKKQPQSGLPNESATGVTALDQYPTDTANVG